MTLCGVTLLDMPLAVRRDSTAGRILATLAVAIPAVARWMSRTVNRVRRAVLVVGSLAAICYAGWQVAQPLGWLLIGAAGLYLEGLTSDPDEV